MVLSDGKVKVEEKVWAGVERVRRGLVGGGSRCEGGKGVKKSSSGVEVEGKGEEGVKAVKAGVAVEGR